MKEITASKGYQVSDEVIGYDLSSLDDKYGKNVTGTAEDLAGKGVTVVRHRKLKAVRNDLNGKIPHKEDGFLKTGKQGCGGRSANVGMLSGQGDRITRGIQKEQRKIKDRLLGSGNTRKENIAIAGTAAKTTGRIAKASGKITAPKINVHPENNRVAAGTIKLSVEPAKKTIRTSAKLIRKAFEQEKNGTVDAAAFANCRWMTEHRNQQIRKES